MAKTTFRFYAELNDFLSSDRRRRSFAYSCAENATVKQAIESLGVPHTEIEVILVNGESVNFSRRIEEGDRLSVYPMFESLDIRPVLRLRPRPLREPRFLADAHLGRLARYLRMLGFDTRYEMSLPDRELVSLSVEERRILLTRDRELLMIRDLTHGLYVRGDRPREQLRYVLSRLDLQACCRPFTRCMLCNHELVAVDRESVAGVVPRRVAEEQRSFSRCPACERIFWRGSHYSRMRSLIDSVLAPRASSPPDSG